MSGKPRRLIIKIRSCIRKGCNSHLGCVKEHVSCTRTPLVGTLSLDLEQVKFKTPAAIPSYGTAG